MSDSNPPDPFELSLSRVGSENKPPPNPWANLLPAHEPLPSLLAKLGSPPVPEGLSPEGLKRIEAALASAPSNPSIPVSERSLVVKLKDVEALGSRFHRENKCTKSNMLSWIARVIAVLKPVFGNAAPYVKGLEQLRKRCSAEGISKEEFLGRVGEIAHFTEFIEAAAGIPSGIAISRPSKIPATKNVFITHGHDELNARRLGDWLRENGLSPIVMRSQPGMSRVLTDKFEAEAAKCTFAFAIFTPDDIVTSESKQYRQARPNVIYETGWFIARLGKERVVLLLRQGAEMHTDLQGVSRIQFHDDLLHSSHDIHRELTAAGLLRLS